MRMWLRFGLDHGEMGSMETMEQTTSVSEAVGNRESFTESSEFVKERLKRSIEHLKQQDLGWDNEELEQMGKVLEQAMDDVFEVYTKGKQIGEDEYLSLGAEVRVHGIEHVMGQTALAIDVMTIMATVEPQKLPPGEDGGQRQEKLTMEEYFGQIYGSLFHESGYLLSREESGDVPSGLFLQSEHEERGVTFFRKMVGELGDEDVVGRLVEDRILGTQMNQWFGEMQQRDDLRVEKLSMREMANVIDLVSYALVGGDGELGTIVDAVGDLLEENFFEVNGGSKPLARQSKASFVAEGFLTPEHGLNFGKKVESLMKWMSENDNSEGGEFSAHWLNLYYENMRQLRSYKEVFEAEKPGDAVQVEGVVEPFVIEQWLKENKMENVWEGIKVEIMKSRIGVGQEVVNRLPTRFLRQIYRQLDSEKKASFVAHVVGTELEQLAEQHVEKVEYKVAPLGWQVPESRRRRFWDWLRWLWRRNSSGEDEVDLEMAKAVYREVVKTVGEKGEVVLSLRAGDNGNNLRLLEMCEGVERVEVSSGLGEEGVISQVKQIRSKKPEIKMNVVVGQVWDEGEEAKAVGRVQEVLSVMGEEDRLCLPTVLLTQEGKGLLDKIKEKKVGVDLCVRDMMNRGFGVEEVVELIDRFETEGLIDKLRLVSMNDTLLDSTTTWWWRLKEAGMEEEVLRRLGLRVGG